MANPVKRYYLAFSAAGAFFMVLFISAPFLSPYGTYAGLDGSPAYIDHNWKITEFPYLIGDIFCHQEYDRSIILNGSQMPVCIRDFGILSGFTAGVLYSATKNEWKDDTKLLLCGAVLASATVIEWAAEQFAGDMPESRFVTGILSGAGIAVILQWVLTRYLKNGSGRFRCCRIGKVSVTRAAAYPLS